LPKTDVNGDLMKAQSLNPEKSKTLLVFLTSFCGADATFQKGVHAGLRHLEKTETHTLVKEGGYPPPPPPDSEFK
jgi:hypothetical protein